MFENVHALAPLSFPPLLCPLPNPPFPLSVTVSYLFSATSFSAKKNAAVNFTLTQFLNHGLRGTVHIFVGIKLD